MLKISRKNEVEIQRYFESGTKSQFYINIARRKMAYAEHVFIGSNRINAV